MSSIPLSPLLSRKRMAALLALATVLAGCASVPPPDDAIALAQNQLQAARDAHAADYAPVDLDFAKGRLDQAQAAMAAQHYGQAAQLAVESQADSRLAMIRGQLGALRAQIKSMSAENTRLRRQLLQPAGGAAPAPRGDSVRMKGWPTPTTSPRAPAPTTDSTELPEQVLPAPAAASSAPTDALNDVDGGVR